MSMPVYEATVSSKGQVTIPKELRDAFSITEGSRIQFVVTNGSARIVPKTRSIMDAAGMLSDPNRQPVSLEEMQEGIIEGAIRGAMGGVE